MIYKGNYRYDFADKLFEVITDAFCEFYGEENEYNVLKSLDELQLSLYNTRQYVEDYYDYFITKFKSEIVHNFCEKLEILHTKDIEDIIWGKNRNLNNCKINIACEGGENPKENDTLSENLQNLICSCRENIVKALDLDADSAKNYTQLLDIRQTFLESVKEIEKLHDCDVFRDISKIEENRKNGIKDVYTDNVANIYSISDNDKKLFSSDNFDSTKLYKLDCNHIFFSNHLENHGYMKYFTTDCNETLKNGHELDKILIKCNRLKYLDKAGFKLEKLDYDGIVSIEDRVRKCRLNALPFNNVIEIYEIEKEYNTQKKKALSNPFVLDVDKKEKIKEWKKGNFIPASTADKLECYRRDLALQLQENTKFTKKYFDSNNENFTIRDLEYNNLMKPHSLVYINDDLASNPMSYLEVFIHELNHVVSSYSPIRFTNKGVVMKGGSGLYSFKRNGMEVIDAKYESDTNNVEEYVNQRQAQDIKDIAIRLIKERNIKIPFDKVVPTEVTNFDVLYDYYGILLEDYYNKYKEELKRQNVEPGYNIYYKYDMAVNKLERLLNAPKDYLTKKFAKKSYYKQGCVDIGKVTALSSLVDDYLENVHPAINFANLNSEDLKDAEKIQKLPAEIRYRLSKLINKKDSIMCAMEKDEEKKCEFENGEIEKELK